MSQISGRTHLGRNQHHIFLHHLVGRWMRTGHITSNGLKAMLHQRWLKWLRTILALLLVSFSILKYKDACYKITVTPISIIQPSFWFPLTRNFFQFSVTRIVSSDSNMIILWKFLQIVNYVNWILWYQVIFNLILTL